jgi:hypothetical protein
VNVCAKSGALVQRREKWVQVGCGMQSLYQQIQQRRASGRGVGSIEL